MRNHLLVGQREHRGLVVATTAAPRSSSRFVQPTTKSTNPCHAALVVNPRRAYILPALLFVLGALVFGLNVLAKVLFPNQWGGPNFLAGAIVILGFAMAAVGAAVMVGTYIANRQDRRAKLPSRRADDEQHPA